MSWKSRELSSILPIYIYIQKASPSGPGFVWFVKSLDTVNYRFFLSSWMISLIRRNRLSIQINRKFRIVTLYIYIHIHTYIYIYILPRTSMYQPETGQVSGFIFFRQPLQFPTQSAFGPGQCTSVSAGGLSPESPIPSNTPYIIKEYSLSRTMKPLIV